MRRWDSVGFLRRSSTSFALLQVTLQSLSNAQTHTGKHCHDNPNMANVCMAANNFTCSSPTQQAVVALASLRWYTCVSPLTFTML